LLEGTFSVRDGVLEVLSAAAKDRALLRRLSLLAQETRDGTLEWEQAERQLAESPELRDSSIVSRPQFARHSSACCFSFCRSL
jgi:hypothetical protein